jgi:transposase
VRIFPSFSSFVAVLGASSYTYAEATWTEELADWIGSHTRAFAFVGGVTAMVVSDHPKSGITKAYFYEPAVNRSYAEMAAHYDTAIVPARPRKPRDKAKVEAAVLLATRWIIAKLRKPDDKSDVPDTPRAARDRGS